MGRACKTKRSPKTTRRGQVKTTLNILHNIVKKKIMKSKYQKTEEAENLYQRVGKTQITKYDEQKSFKTSWKT